MIKRDESFIGRTRDRIAWGLANFALKRIATPWYRAMIGGSIILGLDAATKEQK